MPLLTPSTATVATNTDASSSAAKYSCYIHQIMCSLPASTLLWPLALSEELATILGLTTTLIKTICHTPPLLTRDTCGNTNPIQPPRAICSLTLLPHVPRLIACFALKKSVLCKICSALPACQCHNGHHVYQHHRRLPGPLLQKYQYVFLPTFLTSMQSLSGPCHLAPMLPWYKRSPKSSPY